MLYSICSRRKAEEGCAAVSSSTHFSSFISSSDPHPTAQGISVTSRPCVLRRRPRLIHSPTHPPPHPHPPANIYPPAHPSSSYPPAHPPPPCIYPSPFPPLHPPTYWGTQSRGSGKTRGQTGLAESVNSMGTSLSEPRPVKAESI